MPRPSNVLSLPSTSRGGRRSKRRTHVSSGSDESDSSPLKLPPKNKSRAKKVAKRRLNSSDSDVENQSGNVTLLTQAKPVDQMILVNDLVKTLLNYSATKHLIKTQRVDAEVLTLAKEQLKEVYGLELAEVGTGSSKGWIIYSMLSSGATSLQFPEESRGEITLLFLILSYIYMKGGEVQEAHLIQFLAHLHIEPNEAHNFFGDVGKLIKDKFTRQKYLLRTKSEIEGVNEPQIHVSWGSRANKEFEKKSILLAVAKIMNKSPEMFLSQYESVMQDEPNDEVILMSE